MLKLTRIVMFTLFSAFFATAVFSQAGQAGPDKSPVPSANVSPSSSDESLSNAADHAWNFGVYVFDEKKVFDRVNRQVEAGYTPVGLEVLPGKAIYILYSRLTPIKTNEWVLFDIPQVKDVNPKIQSLVSQGWMPVDISFQPTGCYVLAIKSPAKVLEWRIFGTRDGDAQKLQSDLKAYAILGFVPVGLTDYEGAVWTLVIKTDVTFLGTTNFQSFPNDGKSFIAGLDSQVAQGYSPYGFMISKGVLTFVSGK